jgi:hypothetical protein
MKKIKELTEDQTIRFISECVHKLVTSLEKKSKVMDMNYAYYIAYSLFTTIASDMFCKKHLTKIFKQACEKSYSKKTIKTKKTK